MQGGQLPEIRNFLIYFLLLTLNYSVIFREGFFNVAYAIISFGSGKQTAKHIGHRLSTESFLIVEKRRTKNYFFVDV